MNADLNTLVKSVMTGDEAEARLAGKRREENSMLELVDVHFSNAEIC